MEHFQINYRPMKSASMHGTRKAFDRLHFKNVFRSRTSRTTGCKIQIFSFPFYTLSPEYQIIANFSELVLLCIEADFCTQIRIFQHFSRSTRFSHFCTAFICKIRFKHRSKFCKNCRFFRNFSLFLLKINVFRADFDENFSEFQSSRVDIRYSRKNMDTNHKMIFWTKIRDKMIFWRFPKSVSVLYNYGLVSLRPACISCSEQR